jgi:hypothetical protein
LEEFFFYPIFPDLFSSGYSYEEILSRNTKSCIKIPQRIGQGNGAREVLMKSCPYIHHYLISILIGESNEEEENKELEKIPEFHF